MKLFSKLDSDSFFIFREKWGTMAFGLFLALGLISFGVVFAFVVAPDTKQMPPLIFGWLFLIIGVAMLFGLIPYYRRILRDGGALELKADHAGLTIAPSLGDIQVRYPWPHIIRIDLAEKFETEDADGTSHSWRALIVYLQPGAYTSDTLVSAVKFGRIKTGKGERYTRVNYPKNEAERTVTALRRFVPTSIPINLHEKLVL